MSEQLPLPGASGWDKPPEIPPLLSLRGLGLEGMLLEIGGLIVVDPRAKAIMDAVAARGIEELRL